jgi:hypothetical protein
MDAHKDPAYLAEAKKLDIDVSPIDGAEILGLVDQLSKTPPHLLARVDELVNAGQKGKKAKKKSQ